MLVEAVNKTLRVRWPDAVEIRLVPGRPVAVPEDRARKLLQMAGGRVRIVALAPGLWVTYDSPLFGELTAEVVGVPGDGTVTIYQPLTGAVVAIPLAWVLGLAPPGRRPDAQ